MINLVGLLQKIQNQHGYLPRESLEKAAREHGIPLARVYSLATFYKSFSLTPPARHTITVCLGTACYVRGAPRIVERISRLLDVRPGESTSDHAFKLETANCLGACALGPLVIIDDDYHGNMTAQKIEAVLKKYT